MPTFGLLFSIFFNQPIKEFNQWFAPVVFQLRFQKADKFFILGQAFYIFIVRDTFYIFSLIHKDTDHSGRLFCRKRFLIYYWFDLALVGFAVFGQPF